MEEWQKQFIIKNLPELISLTKFNVKVKARLLANNILSQIDVEELDAESKGKSAASYNYYHCLMTRTGAYKVLAKILLENKQTGAGRILMHGVQNFNYENIDVQGKTLKTHEFFGPKKFELVRKIFRDTITDLDMYDLFVKEDQTLVLAINSIPQEPPFYIPRFLSNRIEVDESIFKTDSSDIFVFRNTIPRFQLSELVKPNSTDRSNSQLTKITCRFIHLDEFEDWDELKKAAKVPIHLINYDNIQEIYLLEDTTAASEILGKVGSKKERIYSSEDEFVQKQFSEKELSVCICDTPGMGKTFLLANIARAMSTHFTETIVVFIQLSTFVADFSLSSTNTTKQPDEAVLHVFKYVSSSREHAELLVKLVEAELLKVEIFFDGFDEIPSNKVDGMKHVFLLLKNQLQNVRIYITSRPHMRHELEKSLGVIAYDMLPFNLQNQVDYLVQFWSPNVPELDQILLAKYAQKCLEEINKTLSRNDKEMAGIPLLCRLIAEVYANKVNFYSTTGTKNINFPFKIASLYQQFIELRFKTFAQNPGELKNTKLVHIWHALKLLFPLNGFHVDEMFTNVHSMMESSVVLKAGIIQLPSRMKLEFIHRTFAEYFAAEYFSTKLQSTAVKPEAFPHKFFHTNDETIKIFSSILNFPLDTDSSNINNITFLHSVVVSFVDFRLNEEAISEETTSSCASFCASISTEEFLLILCSCCNQNLYSLLFVLRKAVTKWSSYHKRKYFTTKNCFKLLEACIRHSTSQMFRSCVQLLTDVQQLDLETNVIFDKTNTLLHKAAEAANYEAVEYLVTRVSLELPKVLKKCVENSNLNDLDLIRSRENILNLLLKKNPTLILETPDILVTDGMHVRLFKMLKKLGANLTVANTNYKNCVMVAADCMSSSDFHELVQFLLSECKAYYLFLDHENWTDPLPYIFKQVELYPETLELLVNIPGVDINQKDWKGENLMFSVVKVNNVNNLQLLVSHGLDYKARGHRSSSLLHVAALKKGLQMTEYLLSLGMDPNSRDEDESTPLHYAAKHNLLSLVKVLVANGANVHAKNINGRTALHLVVESWSNIEIIEYLVRKGAGVNDRDNDGNTLLHLCKDTRTLKCLLETGADIRAKNKKGEIPAQRKPYLWKSCRMMSKKDPVNTKDT